MFYLLRLPMSDVSQRQPNSFSNVRIEIGNTNKESLFVGVYPYFLTFGMLFLAWAGKVRFDNL
jgi:hypothetical protein